MFSFLNNIPTVTKNLLLINVLMFILTEVMLVNGLDLRLFLSIYPINSPLFEPYQIVSHFFMHGGFPHLFMNMFGLVMFGGFLERLWGAKRFFIFFFSAAIGSWFLDGSFAYMEVLNAKNELIANGFKISTISDINFTAVEHPNQIFMYRDFKDLNPISIQYQQAILSSSLGASGGVFGLLAAFAILFPNTEMQLMFIPIPVKAKYMIGAIVLFEVYSAFNPIPGDNVGHLAHLGGAIVGAIIVLFWRKKRTHFY